MISASLHNSVCLSHSCTNFLRGSRVLWKFVLSSYLLSDTSEAKHHPIRPTAFTSHPDTNIYSNTGGFHPCKVRFFLRISLMIELNDTTHVSGLVLRCGLWDWVFKQHSLQRFR